MPWESALVSYGLVPTARVHASPEDDDSSHTFHTTKDQVMALWYPRYTRRAIKSLTCLGVTFLLFHSVRLLDFSVRRYDTWTWTTCPGLSPFEESCTASRNTIAHDALVVVKTGGSEPQSRLRSQLATVLSKVPHQNVVVLSDMEEQVGSHHVHDVYADISEQERASYPEFALYDAQQDFQREGKDTRSMQGGWDLAKYMNLAMKRKIWTMQQQGIGDARKKWFVFIDTDTFVEWDNLLGLLEHLDPAERIYIGSPVWLPGLRFAHGGSAYVLSYGALKALNNPGSRVDPESPLYSQYGVNTTALCCGDEALARALKPKGVNLKGYWPMFNGEIPATVSFGRDTWCEPVISLHHLGGKDMQSLWQWVEDWKVETKSTHPLLFKDLFRYVAPQFITVLEDWDNTHDAMVVEPTKKAAHASFEHCKAACEADKLCFQFVYDGIACALSHHIRIGRQRSPEENGPRRYLSGWNVERIRDWTKTNNCASAHWVRSNP